MYHTEPYPPYRVVQTIFHWKFWSPKACIGGPVRFGLWAVVSGPDGEKEMTMEQVAIKRSMGLIE